MDIDNDLNLFDSVFLYKLKQSCKIEYDPNIWKTPTPEEIAKQKEKEETWAREASAKNRKLGFNPLNKWFPNCVAHHINKNDVVYIPEKLHRKWHDQKNIKSMNKINKSVINWLMSQT